MQTVAPNQNLARNFISCAVGNLIEIFDFTIYGVFIPILSQLFFPAQDPSVSLLQALALYGAGFFMRPLGGIVFGHIGDKWGRKKAFVASILTMMVGTGSIGFLPTYADIGITATILLVFCRLLQGFSVGGEFMGSSLFLLEHTQKGRALWTSSLYSAGASGSMISMAIGFFISLQAEMDWLWRIPFIFSVSIGLVGLYIRCQLEETPSFMENKKKEKIPLVTLLKNYKAPFIAVLLVGAMQITYAYGIFVYNNVYFRQHLHMEPSSAMGLSALGIAEYALLMPFFGMIADRVGYTKVLQYSLVFMIIALAPCYSLLHQSQWLLILLGQFSISAGVAAFCAPTGAYMAEQLPTSVRFTGVAFGYSLGGALIGGFMPAISEYLILQTGNAFMPMYYQLTFSVFALILLAVYHRRKSQYQGFDILSDSLSSQS